MVPLHFCEFRKISLLFMLLEVYHYNFMNLWNIPLHTLSIDDLIFFDQTTLIFLLRPSSLFHFIRADQRLGIASCSATPQLVCVPPHATMLAGPPPWLRRHLSPAQTRSQGRTYRVCRVGHRIPWGLPVIEIGRNFQCKKNCIRNFFWFTELHKNFFFAAHTQR